MDNTPKFYNQPFHKDRYGSWVWDAKQNLCFQFEGHKEVREQIIFSLNSIVSEPIEGLELTVGSDPNEIKNHGKPFITIRGWGNLTGVGGYKFSAEKAFEIQDEFRDWIIFKLTSNG